MPELAIILAAAWIAGLAALVGGFAAHIEGSPDTPAKQELIHGVVAFGGGILLAAVAFALAPEAIGELNVGVLLLTFCVGGVAAAALDAHFSAEGRSKGQFMAMLMDFVPEAIALGAVFAHNPRLGYTFAAFLTAQNLPEGFAAYREAVTNSTRPRRALAVILLMTLIGPLAALVGYLLLQDSPALTAAILSFGAGAILYLVFQDIAPGATLRNDWKPTIGAVLGFAAGMGGHELMT